MGSYRFRNNYPDLVPLSKAENKASTIMLRRMPFPISGQARFLGPPKSTPICSAFVSCSLRSSENEIVSAMVADTWKIEGTFLIPTSPSNGNFFALTVYALAKLTKALWRT